MSCFGAFWAIYFARPLQKICQISAWTGNLVDVKAVLLGSSEFSVRVMMGLVMQEIWRLKFWSMTKCGGTICIIVPHSKFLGLVPLVAVSNVIYAHGYRAKKSKNLQHLYSHIVDLALAVSLLLLKLTDSILFKYVTNLHQLTSQSTTSCPTTWRSYRDHNYCEWRQFTLFTRQPHMTTPHLVVGCHKLSAAAARNSLSGGNGLSEISAAACRVALYIHVGSLPRR